MTYPVQLEVTSPARFDRVQLALRLALSIALGWIGVSAGWLGCALFLALPVLAAGMVSTRRGAGPLAPTRPKAVANPPLPPPLSAVHPAPPPPVPPRGAAPRGGPGPDPSGGH